MAKLRSHAILAVLAVATHLTTALPAAAQGAADAKALVASGDKAAKAKDWAKAQADYRAAHAAAPSAQAVHGLGGASYELKAWGEAYEAYDEFLKSYKDAMGGGARGLAERRLKELETKTGAVTILVNENGAEVTLNDRRLGMSPVRALVRVAVGPQKVRITKAGFAPFEKSVDVGASAKVSVDATLTKEAKTGKLVVKEGAGQAVRVLVDGVDVGPAPWEGELPPGPHEVAVRSQTHASTPQKIEISAGKPSEVTVFASKASGRLEIRTADGVGNIYVDGKLVGEGQWSGDVPAGSHAVKVTREGFLPYEKTLDVADRQSLTETVQLRREGQSLEAVKVEEKRPYHGVYGGFGLLGAMGLGGMGSALDLSDESCKATGARTCDTPSPLGAGAFGYGGYTWNPVGIELFLGGLFDTATQKGNHVNPGAVDTLNGPTRTEEYTHYRFGGVAAVRARAAVDGETVRITLAAGPGLAYKQLLLERKVTTPDGYQDRFVPDDGKPNNPDGDPNKLSYFSPALTADLTLQLRVSATTAVTLGVLGWLESAGNEVAAQPDRKRFLVAEGKTPIPLRTPRHEVASGVQFFLGPYLGMGFGP